jgi:hypothetical protein
MAGFHGRVDFKFIEQRGACAINSGFPVPKYIAFCAWCLTQGFGVWLNESHTTVSKYVNVKDGQFTFKVRFSNHKPNRHKEFTEDSDFFVGVTHTGTRTTEDAKKAVLEWRAKGHGRRKDQEKNHHRVR